MATVLALTSCVTSSNKLVSTSTNRDLSGRGAVLLHFDRYTSLSTWAFELRIDAIDPATGNIKPKSSEDGVGNALAVIRPASRLTDQNGYAAFELPPGRYAITGIREVSAGGNSGASTTPYTPQYYGPTPQGDFRST